jgi:hypothetical protein
VLLASGGRFRHNDWAFASEPAGGAAPHPAAAGPDADALFGGDLMSAGRRGLTLSAGFLAVALALCAGPRAGAQPNRGFQAPPSDPHTGRHKLWNRSLRPEEVREALARFARGEAGADDPFAELLKQAIRQHNPKATPKDVDDAAKQLMANKEFRDRLIDAIQKHQNQDGNQVPNGNPNPNGKGQPPRFTREELERLVKLRPDAGNGGGPFKLPEQAKGGPGQFPPFNPKSKDFDPKKFPFIDPKDPPQFDPKTQFPVNPDTGKPFDPRSGLPIDPQNPPPIAPPPPKGGPPFDPARPPFVPPGPNQPEQPQPDNKWKIDPQNPLGTPPESQEKAAKTKAVETATAIWEKNVGPIEDSPGVKKAIIDLVGDPEAMELLSDGKGNTIFDALEKDNPNGDTFRDFFGGGDSNWEWPKFDLGWGRGGDNDIDFGNRGRRNRDLGGDWGGSSRARGSSAFDGMGSFNLGGTRVPWLLMLLVLLGVAAAVLWWQWGALSRRRGAGAAAAESGGGWPIDPRQINSREDVVKAFEYLSVLLCGAGAKTWTHSTIADELSRLAESEPDAALKLARLYELARYAPLDEPPTRAELLEARRLACELAGLDEA